MGWGSISEDALVETLTVQPLQHELSLNLGTLLFPEHTPRMRPQHRRLFETRSSVPFIKYLSLQFWLFDFADYEFLFEVFANCNWLSHVRLDCHRSISIDSSIDLKSPKHLANILLRNTNLRELLFYDNVLMRCCTPLVCCDDDDEWSPENPGGCLVQAFYRNTSLLKFEGPVRLKRGEQEYDDLNPWIDAILKRNEVLGSSIKLWPHIFAAFYRRQSPTMVYDLLRRLAPTVVCSLSSKPNHPVPPAL